MLDAAGVLYHVVTMADTVRVDNGSETRDARGEWVPRILRTRAALFAWPPRPKAALRFLHPIHLLYLMQRAGLNPTVGHTGFDQVVINKDRDTRMSIDSFFHYLHHRYFECNYGNGRLPLDRWFGTFHDGSEQAHAATRRKRAVPPEIDEAIGAL